MAVGLSVGTTLVAAGLAGIEATFAAGAMFDDPYWIGGFVGIVAGSGIIAGSGTIVPVSR